MPSPGPSLPQKSDIDRGFGVPPLSGFKDFLAGYDERHRFGNLQ